MRRSKNVVAPLLASAAVSLLAACRTTEMQRCVDATNHVSDPTYCQQGQGNGSTGYFGGGGGGYHYIYGGSGNYAPGSVVPDGSTTPVSGHSYSTTSGTSRGGFGGLFGGGAGGGGGE